MAINKINKEVRVKIKNRNSISPVISYMRVNKSSHLNSIKLICGSPFFTINIFLNNGVLQSVIQFPFQI